MTTNVSFCWNGKVDTFLDVDEIVLKKTIESLREDQDWKIMHGTIKKFRLTLIRGYKIIVDNKELYNKLKNEN